MNEIDIEKIIEQRYQLYSIGYQTKGIKRKQNVNYDEYQKDQKIKTNLL